MAPSVDPHGRPTLHTAQSILDAGEFLFQRQGFHGTSMRQIARFAGITPAAIYNHFPSKEEIFVALLKARLPHRTLALAVSGPRAPARRSSFRTAFAVCMWQWPIEWTTCA
jgi:AcrR family transcriptional regulator